MWTSLIPAIGSIVDKLIPDPKMAADAKLKAVELAQKGELAHLDAEVRLALGQIEVNKAEAGTDLFRGGWRPMVGWICALGLGIQFIVAPFFTFFSNTPFPQLDMSTLMTLLLGMLGLGAMRTQEKINGIK